MALSPAKVTIQILNGSRTDILVKRGTRISEILDHEDFKVSAGYRSRLVSEAGEFLEPEMKVWKKQVGAPQTKNVWLARKDGMRTLLYDWKAGFRVQGI